MGDKSARGFNPTSFQRVSKSQGSMFVSYCLSNDSQGSGVASAADVPNAVAPIVFKEQNVANSHWIYSFSFILVCIHARWYLVRSIGLWLPWYAVLCICTTSAFCPGAVKVCGWNNGVRSGGRSGRLMSVFADYGCGCRLQQLYVINITAR